MKNRNKKFALMLLFLGFGACGDGDDSAEPSDDDSAEPSDDDSAEPSGDDSAEPVSAFCFEFTPTDCDNFARYTVFCVLYPDCEGIQCINAEDAIKNQCLKGQFLPTDAAESCAANVFSYPSSEGMQEGCDASLLNCQYCKTE